MAHIINRGGTCLYTARSDEFRTKEGREKAYLTCKLLGIDGLVAIGGDGTFAGCLAFANEHDISVIGIPATIDNDIGCTHYALAMIQQLIRRWTQLISSVIRCSPMSAVL